MIKRLVVVATAAVDLTTKFLCCTNACIQILQIEYIFPGQSDEILMIGGLNCPQSVVKFNTKTNQWSKMPVCLLYK